MITNIKTDSHVLSIIASALLTASVLDVSAQPGIETGTAQVSDDDSIRCRGIISLYKTSYSDKDFTGALDFWRQVLAECPSSSEDLYTDGESIYSELYRNTSDKAYIDTILMILTRRTYYFNNKPSNDLHKSELLFELAGDDPVYLELCYNILKEVAGSFPDQMECSHFVSMTTAAASLYEMGIIDAEELARAFVKAIGTVEAQLESDSDNCRDSEDFKNMETFFRASGAMTCASIETLYSQKVDRHFRDTALINKVFAMLTETGCTGSDLYYNVAVKLFANDRSAENAVRLAELNVARNNIEKAVSYFTEAYNRDTSRVVRSQVLTRVAAMELSQGKREEARDRGEHAWRLDNRNGKALLIVADCYAGAELGNAFDNHSAYWVAVDYLMTARSTDPSLKETADIKIKAYSKFFPTREECFYRNILDEGVVYRIGGWINEVTRVRFRRE